MGSGEEGLARSLAWGKRTVKARVYTDKTSKIAFSTAHLTQARLAGSVAKSSTQMASTPSPQILKVASLEEKLEAFTKIRTSLESGLGTESVIQIRNTQNALRILGYIKAPSTGTFGPSTRTAIRAFEESRGVMFRTKVLMSDETRQELATVLLARGIESIDEMKN